MAGSQPDGGESQLKLWIYLVIAIVAVSRNSVDGVRLYGKSSNAFATYPKWDACINASIYFEFQTRGQENGLLLYVDDGGRYDFIEVVHSSGQVKVVFNLVDGRDGNKRLTAGQNVDDGDWHSVEIRRNRMQTILTVDNKDRRVAFSHGSDFHFGALQNNSYVYIGGLPRWYNHDLSVLALPSVLGQNRFDGSVRNVLYSNCSCQTVRATMIEGQGISNTPPEACESDELRQECGAGCVCMSSEAGAKCDCSQQECIIGQDTHYTLSFNVLEDRTLINPSGLDALTYGYPALQTGILGRSIQLNNKNQFVEVAGPGHKDECFGDLDKCPKGYTLSYWVNFQRPQDEETVYLSNGGHSSRCHGVAQLYDKGNLAFVFRKRNGQEWRVNGDNVLPGRWYHVTATWLPSEGLELFINGEKVDEDTTPRVRSPSDVRENRCKEFYLGRPSGPDSYNGDRTVLFDEFHFWSSQKMPAEIREHGPFYNYLMTMESLQGSRLNLPNLDTRVVGRPIQVDGKIGKALSLNGNGQYIDGGDFKDTCLGNLSLCDYGATIASWVKFDDLKEGSYIFDTGNTGLRLFVSGNSLVAEAQAGERHWLTSWEGVLETDRWYFVEVSWSKEGHSLDIYLDLEQIAHETVSEDNVTPHPGSSHLLVGNSNNDMTGASCANAVFDQTEIFYGDRDRLLRTDFIARGRPTVHMIDMDSVSNNKLSHPYLDINLYRDPVNVQGKIGGALNLNGNGQYAAIDRQNSNCFGNMDYCRHGMLFAGWIHPQDLKNREEFMSTGQNGLQMWYEGGKLKLKLQTTMRTWELETSHIRPHQWQFLELSFDPVDGLKLYSDDQLIQSTTRSSVRTKSDSRVRDPDHDRVYVGKGSGRRANMEYGNFVVDEMEYWYGDRDYLLAWDYIQRGKPTRYLIKMDGITNGRVDHETLMLPVPNGGRVVQGRVNGGLFLNGQQQYVDVGDHARTCYGDLSKCKHGITGSMWTNFKEFKNDMYYLSSGRGLKMFHKNGRLYFVFQTGGKEWEVVVPYLETDKWEFVEYTWHPQKGLQVYLNDKLVGAEDNPTSVNVPPENPDSKLYVGRANDYDTRTGRFNYADFVVDEFDTWFSHRDYLLAHGYIQRGNVTHYQIPLEEVARDGIHVVHPTLKGIKLEVGARLKPAYLGNGADLEGAGEHLTLGEFPNECLGDTDMCHNGLTFTFHLFPRQLQDNMYFIAAKDYAVYYKNGRTYAELSAGQDRWVVSTDKVRPSQWNRVDLSWDRTNGLELYVDDKMVASSNNRQRVTKTPRNDDNVYVGSPHSDSNGIYTNGLVDEIEVWYASRNYLMINKTIDYIIIPMDEIRDNRIVHPDLQVDTYGRPVITRGVINGAVYLNGKAQYIDGGERLICNGNIEQCTRGLTLRYKIRPRGYRNNTYYLSSGPVNIYYMNGKWHVRVRSPNRQWTTTLDASYLPDDTWSQFDLSWEDTDGLRVFVNDRQVAHQPESETYDTDEYRPDARFYLGRRGGDSTIGRYPTVLFDDVQIWKAKRDLVKDSFPEEPPQTTPRPVPTPTVPPISPQTKYIYLNGQYWVTYSFPDQDTYVFDKPRREEIDVRFRTDKNTGMLWYSGDDERNTHLGLKNGDLLFVTEENGQVVDSFRIAPSRPLTDNEWHNVIIKRNRGQVTFNIDGRKNTKRLSNDVVFVPTDKPFHLGGSYGTTNINRNFIGNLTEVKVISDGTDVDMVKHFLTDPRPEWIFINQGQLPTARPDEVGVKFRSPDGFIRLPKWEFLRSGSLDLKFRTHEPHGLMLYNGGQPGRSDFVAIEMYDGIPYFVIDLGDGVHRYPFSTTKLNDGEEHHLQVERTGNDLSLVLDNRSKQYTIPGTSSSLELGTQLYIGGHDDPRVLPWHLWTRESKFYVGCLWDLRLNLKPYDLVFYSRDQNPRFESIVPGCQQQSAECPSKPCSHGLCRETWRGYECDCTDMPYMGKDCDVKAPVYVFEGQDLAKVRFTPTVISHTNDITLRFKTFKKDGLLFKTSNQINDHTLQLSLEDGKGRLDTNLGGQPKSMYFCEKLNNNEWHTLYVKRQANHMEAWVDSCPESVVTLPNFGYTLDVDNIVVASETELAPYDKTFVGTMQNFYFNNKNLFEYFVVKPPNKTDGDSDPPINKVTYRSNANNYVTLDPLEKGSGLDISMMFKTRHPDGILFFNEGKDGVYMTVYLSDGHLFFLAEGELTRKILKVSNERVNDNKWHQLRLRPDIQYDPFDPMKLAFILDGQHFLVDMRHLDNDLDLSGPLYIGGLEPDMYRTLPSLISSRQSFAGCLATMVVKGQLIDLYRDGRFKSDLITEGCTDATSFCKSAPCKNFGRCVDMLTGYRCDCNMTSFIGPTCEEEAEGYRYMKNGRTGIMEYRFVPPIDTNRDELAFGFMTWQPNGTLVRVDSGISADYIDARLVNGHVVMSWDIGNGREMIVGDQRGYDDGEYHYVTFVRDGKTATVRVDDYPSTTKTSDGNSLQFTDLAVIRAGGTRDINNKIVNPFDGIISGLYFNGTRFIDMGVIHNSPAIITGGDILVAKHKFNLPQPKPPSEQPPIATDAPIDGGGGGVVTPRPIDPEIPHTDIEVPADHGGGGVAWAPVYVGPGAPGGVGGGDGGGGTGTGGGDGDPVVIIGGDGGGRSPDGIAVAVDPSGGGVAVWDGGEPGVVPGSVGGPVIGQQVGALGAGAGAGESARAAGIAGAFIGVLVAASSIMWAVYKFKPGLLKLGGGAGAGKGGPVNISSPSNYKLLKAAGGGPGVGYTYGSGGGGGGGGIVTSEMNGAPPPRGGFTTTMSSFGTQTALSGQALNANEFGSSSAASMSGIAGVIAGGGAVTRPTQTNLSLFNAAGGAYGFNNANMSMSASSMNGYSHFGDNAAATSTMMKESYHKSYYESKTDGTEFSAGRVTSVAKDPAPIGQTEIACQTVANCGTQTDIDENASTTGMYSGGGSYMETSSQHGGAAAGYSQTLPHGMQQSSYYKESMSTVNHMNTLPPGFHQQNQQVAPYATDTNYRRSLHMNATNLFGAQTAENQAAGLMMTSEEIRVDCAMLTQNGRYVVTGSIYGPPQIWDMKTGALVRLMEGEDMSSTDLHLACSDSLLVGQVAEMTQVNQKDLARGVHHRKLQIWDFETGHPLEMAHSESCTASAMMNDGTRIVLGRTEKYGNSTTIVLWDLLGNQPIRRIHYDGSIGFADYISMLKLSLDNRYVIAGFQNSYDGKANYLIFDLTVEDYTTNDPKILSLDAVAECSAILENHEVVTGTRGGQLTIWSARTGKALRQLVSPAQLPLGGGAQSLGRGGAMARTAHTREVKAVELSHDRRLLVSVSGDHTVKVWNMENERLMFTLKGHTDEVLCCTISNDDEILVTGGKDGSIRLWRLQTGQHVCSFNTGVDIFTVKMSSDRRTVVALGDHQGARKLIMLRVVVTKVRSHAGSRATSPTSLQSDGYNYNPY